MKKLEQVYLSFFDFCKAVSLTQRNRANRHVDWNAFELEMLRVSVVGRVRVLRERARDTLGQTQPVADAESVVALAARAIHALETHAAILSEGERSEFRKFIEAIEENTARVKASGIA